SISAAQASGSRTAATVRPLQTTRRVRRDLAGTKPDPRAIENASPRVKQLVEERRAGQRTAKATFLRDVYADACKIFGTVLSPDANEAHRNHFHVDLAKRRRSAYCR
ncbi:MAG: extensin family protein, partial [Pseudomonadota bacterium]